MDLFDSLKECYPRFNAYYNALLPEDNDYIAYLYHKDEIDWRAHSYMQSLCTEPGSALNAYLTSIEKEQDYNTIVLFLKLFALVRGREDALSRADNGTALP